MNTHNKKVEQIRQALAKVKHFPETDEEFLATLNFYVICAQSWTTQKLGYAGSLGPVPIGTKIDQEKVEAEIQNSPFFKIISLHLTHMSKNLKLCPHPEDDKKGFKKWFEATAKKYGSKARYHPLFNLVKKIENIIAK